MMVNTKNRFLREIHMKSHAQGHYHGDSKGGGGHGHGGDNAEDDEFHGVPGMSHSEHKPNIVKD